MSQADVSTNALIPTAYFLVEDEVDDDKSEVFAWLRLHIFDNSACDAFDATAKTVLSNKEELTHFRKFLFLEGMEEVTFTEDKNIVEVSEHTPKRKRTTGAFQFRLDNTRNDPLSW
jgi:hypothetical protein